MFSENPLNIPPDPATYDAWFDSPLGSACLASEIQLLEAAAGEVAGKAIVELGCGTGRVLLGLVRPGDIAVGIDRDRGMLQIARQKATLRAKPCVWVQANATSIPFASNCFDMALENTLLCSCSDPAPIIREMIRICKPGGVILLGELNPFAPWQLWRRLKAWFGYGSFRDAIWHSPSHLQLLLAKAQCSTSLGGRAIFFPPINARDVFKWRTVADSAGRRAWPWAGAYYVLAGVKRSPD